MPRQDMYCVGLTGGIASGKSALADRLHARGAFLADADLVAREVVAPGQPALAEITAHFGNDVLQADGQLDRAMLRRRIFANLDQRKALEAITHPRIRRALHDACMSATAPYAVVAIPLLAEGGGRSTYPWLDRIVVVDVPVELQRMRLLARDGIDAALVDGMIAAQANRAQRLAIADDVVTNTGTLGDLDVAADRLDRLYRGLAAA
ncbi:dephospho-CoA kinase [Solilutibacter silvestris]|uniref:Dephospho-CoA kinase n=1 Tax=Solilutibacter silvestris TaxID=1645665 RepID=A0A2K1Q2M7_9GAMM|nr:dephospho-CoA kinase [Lysobacter silvestris]PNS09292.1 dephospho-CoA kinase [Lysobacter silvestris]